MAQAFVGQVMMFAGNFAPKGFVLCQGQLLPKSQNQALFNVLQYNYGGSGSAFAMPNLGGYAAVGVGEAEPGGYNYQLAQTYGETTALVGTSQVPLHVHNFVATSGAGTTLTAANNVLADTVTGTKGAGAQANIYSANLAKAATKLPADALSQTGGNGPHNNMQPYLPIAMCICVQGTTPNP